MRSQELELTNSALDMALRFTGQRLGNVQLVNWEGGWLEIAAQRGFHQDFLEVFQRVSIRDGCACGRALFLRQTVVIDDVSADHDFRPFVEVAKRAGFSAVQSTPLITPGGAVLGIISTHGGYNPSSPQLEQIRSLAQQTANELIRLRARVDAVLPSGRKLIQNARNLLDDKKPDTFLGARQCISKPNDVPSPAGEMEAPATAPSFRG